jgi:hypothetical protein
MRPHLLCLLCLLAALLFLASARADESFFKKNDVIALVGGEDMVVASEEGYLETLLTRALPDYHLRFRSLAWEGDTVYEQRRDLNFPIWEEQLDKIGATVVICQFGRMESFAGGQKLPEFLDAYQKLLERFTAGGKRRVVLIQPTPLRPIPGMPKHILQERSDEVIAYINAPFNAAKKAGGRLTEFGVPEADQIRKDGVHLTSRGQFRLAFDVASALAPVEAGAEDTSSHSVAMPKLDAADHLASPESESLRQLIVAKNKLWFDYWRVQNWAFLAGDRTNQPSSRDHRDPSKRWFPAEREEFIPLIEAKEREIDALAAKLSQK